MNRKIEESNFLWENTASKQQKKVFVHVRNAAPTSLSLFNNCYGSCITSMGEGFLQYTRFFQCFSNPWNTASYNIAMNSSFSTLIANSFESTRVSALILSRHLPFLFHSPVTWRMEWGGMGCGCGCVLSSVSKSTIQKATSTNSIFLAEWCFIILSFGCMFEPPTKRTRTSWNTRCLIGIRIGGRCHNPHDTGYIV